MTPLTIDTTVSSLSNAELGEKLHFLSYTFCVNADFSKTEATAKLIDDLEVCMMEGLLRILEVKFGYKPFQNRIYEKVEKTFKNQDAAIKIAMDIEELFKDHNRKFRNNNIYVL